MNHTQHRPGRARPLNAVLTAGALIGTGLLLAACPAPAAKGLKVEKVDVGAATVAIKCGGPFVASIDLTSSREAPPPAPARSYPMPTSGKASTGQVDNITGLSDVTYGNAVDTDRVAFNGTVADTCKPGSFTVTFAEDQGPKPTPETKTVTVPALGYSLPSGIPLANANGANFTSRMTVHNCGSGTARLTVTAKAADNLTGDPTVTPEALSVAAGRDGEVTISGAKVDAHKGGSYTLKIAARGAGASECVDQGLVK